MVHHRILERKTLKIAIFVELVSQKEEKGTLSITSSVTNMYKGYAERGNTVIYNSIHGVYNWSAEY